MYNVAMALYVPLLAVLLAVGSFSKVPENFNQIARQADAARAQSRSADAIHLYQRGLRLKPAWRDGWWSLATLYYDEDRFQEADDAFRQFATLTAERGPAEAFMGLCEYESKQYDSALDHFRAWARVGWPSTPSLLDVAVFHFALLLTRDGEFVRALYLLAPEAAKVGENPALAEAMGLA